MAHGSYATIAATEWVCEHAQKRPLSDVKVLSHEDIIKDLHLHRVKMHSALLAIDAFEAAVADFQA